MSRRASLCVRRSVSYWSARMGDQLADAETLRFDGGGRILEIGAPLWAEVDGPYIALVCFRAGSQRALDEGWDRLVRSGTPNPAGRTWDLACITALIQHLIDRGWNVREPPILGGWLEFDQTSDLRLVDAGF